MMLTSNIQQIINNQSTPILERDSRFALHGKS